ncbi:MFS transporter [Actinobaculum sp. 313]|uniref:MFS transporter n=1 Tax=Actinobaculum sp. 313 TaxID=2495645 RepID=UPI0013DE2F89|nr:MFS transporter [Actinobaculum sp. 313]
MTGALLAARRRSQPRVRLVVAMAFAFALAAGVNAVMPTYPTYAISLIPVGLVILTLLTSANTSVQMSTEPEMRGRVMSLYQAVMQGSAPVGALIVGWICEVISPRWGVGIGAIGALIVGIAAYVWGRRNWDVAVHYHWHSHPHVEIIGPLERQQQEHSEGDGLGAGPTPGDDAK